jgi:hypothetical protein
MNLEEKFAELERRRKQSELGGGPERIKKTT